MLLAQESLYLTVTAVLSTMDISPFDPKMPAKFEHTEGLVRFVPFLLSSVRATLSYSFLKPPTTLSMPDHATGRGGLGRRLVTRLL